MAGAQSILILGAGDFSGALTIAMANSTYDATKAQKTSTVGKTDHPAARSLNHGVSLIATEYRTDAESDTLFKRIDNIRNHGKPKLALQPGQHDLWTSNMNGIRVIGGQVIEGFNALTYPANTGMFDRIIFEYPHTGSYGSSVNDVRNMQAVNSNRVFLENIMTQAREHLTAHGFLEIGICGWPYRSNPTRQQPWDEGMGLEDTNKATALAANLRLRFIDRRDLGLRRVARNDGTYFQADMLYLRFQRA